MDGQVSGLGIVHPLLTLSFFSTWILSLHVVSSTLMRKSSSSIMDGLQIRRESKSRVTRSRSSINNDVKITYILTDASVEKSNS